VLLSPALSAGSKNIGYCTVTMESEERLAQQSFGGHDAPTSIGIHIVHAYILSNPCERHADVGVAEAQVTQRGGDLAFGGGGAHVGWPRRVDLAVGAAVGVEEAQTGCVALDVPLQDEVTSMDGPMVRPAEGAQVRGLVGAAFGARHDVVKVEERRVLAARYAAAMLVTGKHGPAQRRRNGLAGACARMGSHRCAGINRARMLTRRCHDIAEIADIAHVLSVAARHRDDLGSDADKRSAAVLLAASAACTHSELPSSGYAVGHRRPRYVPGRTSANSAPAMDAGRPGCICGTPASN
jgi:hypothetical protein